MGSPVSSTNSANQYAFFTFGIAALYILLAVATHVVLIGVVPVLMAVRSLRAQERLAPVAMGVAILTVIVAFATLSGH
jgi:hypothetical protein